MATVNTNVYKDIEPIKILPDSEYDGTTDEDIVASRRSCCD